MTWKMYFQLLLFETKQTQLFQSWLLLSHHSNLVILFLYHKIRIMSQITRQSNHLLLFQRSTTTTLLNLIDPFFKSTTEIFLFYLPRFSKNIDLLCVKLMEVQMFWCSMIKDVSTTIMKPIQVFNKLMEVLFQP